MLWITCELRFAGSVCDLQLVGFSFHFDTLLHLGSFAVLQILSMSLEVLLPPTILLLWYKFHICNALSRTYLLSLLTWRVFADTYTGLRKKQYRLTAITNVAAEIIAFGSGRQSAIRLCTILLIMFCYNHRFTYVLLVVPIRQNHSLFTGKL